MLIFRTERPDVPWWHSLRWFRRQRGGSPRGAELQKNLKQAPVLNIDETGWRTSGDKRYPWVFVAAQYAVYTVAATRGGKVLVQILGTAFRGVLCSDGFSEHLNYHKEKAQFRWAHLKRTLLGIAEFTKANAVERFCRDALAQHAKLFR